MSKPPEKRGATDGLNPGLKAREDSTHGTSESTPAPTESVSVQREEGRFWPFVWAAATIAGILIVLWILFG